MRGLDPLSVGLFLMVPFWHRAGSNATHTSTDYPCQELNSLLPCQHVSSRLLFYEKGRQPRQQISPGPHVLFRGGGTWSCWDGWLARSRDKSLSACGDVRASNRRKRDRDREEETSNTLCLQMWIWQSASGLLCLTVCCNSSNDPLTARWPFSLLLLIVVIRVIVSACLT